MSASAGGTSTTDALSSQTPTEHDGQQPHTGRIPILTDDPSHQDTNASSKPNPCLITTRTDLSVFYRFIRTLIRPVKPHLVGLNNPPYPVGSPKIRDHPKHSSYYACRIVESCVLVRQSRSYPLTQVDSDSEQNGQRMWLYEFVPEKIRERQKHGSSGKSRAGSQNEEKSESRDKEQERWYTHTIYYFGGGGFRATPQMEHRKLCARLANALCDQKIRIVIVSYPLAPNSPAKDSLPTLRAWLIQTLRECTGEGEMSKISTDEVFNLQAPSTRHGQKGTVSLMGDSAGGNIVLSLAFWWAGELAKSVKRESAQDSEEEEDERPEPHVLRALRSIIALSPPTDFRNTNPLIKEAERKDPVMTTKITNGAADNWCAGLSKSDPELSLNLQPASAWAELRDSGITVNGIVGTYDCLGPDAEVFMRKCEEESVRGEWLFWKGQMHCFPLLQAYFISEGKEGLQWLIRIIRKDLNMSDS